MLCSSPLSEMLNTPIKSFPSIQKTRYFSLRNSSLSGRRPWQSPCWLSRDVSPFYGKLQNGFGCMEMRNGCLLGFAFPLEGNSTHTRPSCKIWQHRGLSEMSFAEVLNVLCCWDGWAQHGGAGSRADLCPLAMLPQAALLSLHCRQGAIQHVTYC